MKIPTKLKIGGHTVAVRIGEFPEGDNTRCGETTYEKNEITINRNLSQSQKEATLVHEILHVCNTTLNHELLDSIAEQLYQVLSDNKLLK